MAGGGYGTGSGIPLQDRVRGRSAAPEPPLEPGRPGAGSTGARQPGRHCWLSTPVDGTSARPGLLLEWRKVEHGRWEGLVVYAAQLRPGRWATVTEWVPAELLST